MTWFVNPSSRLIICFCFLLFPSSILAQENNRLMKWLSSDNGTQTLLSPGYNQKFNASEIKALVVISVTVDGKPILFGQEFSANDDWIGKLAFRLKNTSQKTIVSISLGFSLPESQNGENRSGFSFVYGKALERRLLNEQSRPMFPGEEIELKLSEIEYRSFMEGIANRSLITNFKLIHIGNAIVHFDDGTIWLGLSLPVLDKSNQ